VVLGLAITPLAVVAKNFNIGDKVRVTVSFKYVVGVNATVKVSAGPYYTNLFGKHMVDSCVGQSDLSLVAASSPTLGNTTIEFILVPKANGGIDDGTYGLRVWVEGTNAVAEQDSVIIVSGNPSSSGGTDMLTSMMPMLMMVMMMGMMAPMMQGMGGGSEE
jgi:hypothetical protein